MDLTRKNNFLEGCFKFNNIGLAISIILKFFTSVLKWLKLKVRRFGVLIPAFLEVKVEKLVGGRYLTLDYVRKFNQSLLVRISNYYK